jgi:uncharacterized protein YidB (DUF937 family)
MGIFDDLTKGAGGLGGTLGNALGGGAQGGQGALVQAVVSWLAGGGLQQLMASFQQKGLGHVVGSWVSTGANEQVSPDQLRDVIGPDQLGRLAQQSGLDVGAVTSQLTALLPGLVDKLTPDGDVPQGGALQERIGGLLKGIF